jgi:hypothetical protein
VTSSSNATRPSPALAPCYTRSGGLIAFFSNQIVSCHAKLAAYEWELICLVLVVRHRRHYLLGRAFLIRTNHISLKFLLDQRLSTIPQHQWPSKLLGFDFQVEFKPGQPTWWQMLCPTVTRKNHGRSYR